ncbi:MAG TPA: C4-dicarboxylate ABC transporter substrate-binding protein [Cyanothece sp. UBA12306]|nr:C4-dicarboxylate ABC transporter substrate-binding protein [Cyanothece sp. UBA12306]
MLKKATLSIVVGSLVMVGIFSVAWFQDRYYTSTLTLATGGKTGQYYAFGETLAKVVAKHKPHFRIKVIQSNGAVENLELLAEKKADLAIIQSDTTVTPDIKAVSFLFPEMFHLIVRKDSGITKVGDLEGKRIALMPENSGSYQLFWVLSHHYQIDETELTAIPLSPTKAHQALSEGKVDAMFRVLALGNPSVTKLLQNPQLEIIPIDQASALKLKLPALEKGEIPKGAYHGAIPIPPQDLSGVGVRAILVTREKIDQELIFELTRILNEARNDLAEEFTPAAMIPEPQLYRHWGFSFHQGANAYYDQGKPTFIVEYAEPIGLGVSVTVLLISSIWQFRMWLQGKQKNRADFYNLELLILIKKIQETQDIKELYQVRSKLLEMLELVVVDLDKDRISPQSFESFTFPWEVALSSIHHREQLLINGSDKP